MSRLRKTLLALLVLVVSGVGGILWAERYTTFFIFPQVWSQTSPAGQSYEFKVNQEFFTVEALETGFLSRMDKVTVTDPDGQVFELNRDYNINSYSGEVTRRFVLYGPEVAELPQTGRYRFDFWKSGELKLTKYVDYVQDYLGIPTGIRWERRESDIYVEWTPPENAGKENWYKVLIWSIGDTPETFVSLSFKGTASSGLLEDVPLLEGGEHQLNVAFYSDNGYSYSNNHYFIWDDEATLLPG